MKLSLFNTLTKKEEYFFPHDEDLIKMYVCGPTVYDRPHLGNARSVVIYDVLYRILINIYGKDKVKYVRNITDIDDKIIDRAEKEDISVYELTQVTTKYFHQDTDYLNCLRPNFEPKATDHIGDMISIIEKLLAKDVAYKSCGHIYFDITKYADYAKLSGRVENELLNSVRIDSSPGKKNPGDFVLWKPAFTHAQDSSAYEEGKERQYNKFKADDSNCVFESPFGRGRPGWHIECSAMSYRFLGENFDIHGGGADLIFPHHTNEIAQSCAAFENSKYAKIWVHNGFLTVNHEKMSKSLGNFLTVKDLIDKQIKGDVIRLFLLSAHYRKPLDYSEKAVKDCTLTLNYWYKAIGKIESRVNEDFTAINMDLPEDFITALLDDVNTVQAIKITNDYAKIIYADANESRQIEAGYKLLACANFLGLMYDSPSKWFDNDVNSKEITRLIESRNEARKEKNWFKADKIRKALEGMGVVIEDNADGTTSRRKKY